MHHRTALYLRISTADQKPDRQFDDLRAYAARAHLTIVRAFASEQRMMYRTCRAWRGLASRALPPVRED